MTTPNEHTEQSERETIELPIIGVVLQEHASSKGLNLLMRMASSIENYDGMACWDHIAMFDLRDEIERLLDVEAAALLAAGAKP